MLSLIKNYFFPASATFTKEEVTKFIYMFVIIFLIAFNYNTLRPLKDTLIITAYKSGAEAIPFITFWLILPAAIFMSIAFTKLSHKYGTEKVFYLMITFFISFFTIFILVLYPLRDILHPNNFADYLETILPSGFKGLIAIIRNWTITSFYVISELWGTIILNVLFWGFANDVSTIVQAKKFYSILGIGANISGIFSGILLIKLSNKHFNPSIHFGQTAWDQSLLFIIMISVFIGILIMFLYRKLNTKIEFKKQFITPEQKNIKFSFKKNFHYILKSKYLIYIALLVISYNLVVNLVEVLWKNQTHLLYPNPNDFNAYMGIVNTCLSILATVIAIIATGFLKKFSWTTNALITPIIIAITGICFFSCFLLNNVGISTVSKIFHTTPLILCIFFGSMQNCISRSLKYSLFDATKEMSFIPLSYECKLKGKSIIDGVMSRLGKSVSSLTYQILLICFSTLSAITPLIAIIFIVIIMIWISSVKSLGKQFNDLEKKEENLILQAQKKQLSINQTS